MKRIYSFLPGLLAGALFVTSIASAHAEELTASWKNGLRFQSADKNIQIKIGGRIHNDWTFWLDQDEAVETAVGELEDGVRFRRARLAIDGLLYDKFEFKAQYDFADGDADFRDVYLGFTKTPLGHIRIGQFKEAFSLEELNSSNVITFVERALPNVFVPGRSTGIQIYNRFADDMVTWAIGAFRDSDDYGNHYGDDEGAFTTRLTVAPINEDQGRQLLHLGLAYSYRRPNDDLVKYRSRPEVREAPYFLDTGDLSADEINLFGAELAFQREALSLQGEYVLSQVGQTGGLGTADLQGFYVQASYLLTGEHRPYRAATAEFGGVDPQNPFIAADSGAGAWELALRYSYLDLDDSTVSGGELSDITVGVNWYLAAFARIMLNYVYADRDEVGKAHALVGRLQVHF